MERDTAPTYYYNKHPAEEINYIRIQVKTLCGYHYVSPHQKQVIKDNINSNIESELPVPLFPNCVNLAGSQVSRKQAIENAVEYTREVGGLCSEYSWAAGFKLLTKYKDGRGQYITELPWHTSFPIEPPPLRTPTRDFWVPYGSWQQLPAATTHSSPEASVDFIGYNPNTNWLPYNTWFNAVHFNLSKKLPEPISKHILSFWIWRRIPKKGTRPLNKRKPPLNNYIGSSKSKPRRNLYATSDLPVVNQNTSEQRSWAELYGETNPWFDYNSRERRNNRLIPTTVNPQESFNPVNQNIESP